MADSHQFGGRWGAVVVTAALALCALCAAAQPAAAASLTELVSLPGSFIEDAQSDRVLYRPLNSIDGPLRVRTVSTQGDVTIPLRANREFGTADGRLIPGGVLFFTESIGGNSLTAELDQWKAGDSASTLVGEDANGDLDTAGDYAIWVTGPPQDLSLIRRTLSTGTNVTVTVANAGGTEDDVAANGDVVFWDDTTPYDVFRWRNGVPLKLSNSSAQQASTYPRTDGTLTVYRRMPDPVCCAAIGGSIYFSDGLTETELPGSAITGFEIDRPDTPEPDVHYAIAGGWIAYVRGAVDQVWTRSPAGTLTDVSAGSPAGGKSLVAVAPSGQVMFNTGSRTFLGSPGVNPFPLDSFDWRAFSQGGSWYILRNDALLRLETDTAITASPAPVTQDTTADFELASTALAPDYECKLDGAVVACDDDEEEFSTGALTDGVHTFSAAVTDPAGPVQDSTPATVTWRVDTTPPTVPQLVSPADGQAVKSPALEWSAASDPGGSGVTAYRVFVDGSQEGTTSSTTFTPSGVGNGSHTWFVRAVDGAGLTRDSATRTFTVDTTSPTEPHQVAPADYAVLSTARPTFSWTESSDAGSGIVGYDVELGGEDSDRTRVGAGQTSFTPSVDVPDGNHAWRVLSVDAAGNRTPSPHRQFRVDTRPPTASLGADPNPAGTGQSVRLDAGGSKPGGAALTQFEWDLDGDGSFERDTGASSSTEQTYATPQEHAVRVRVIDAAGRSATAAVALRVTPAPPPGPAGISIDAGARFTNDPNVTLTLRWPLFATAMLVSNDGGFDGATSQPVTPQLAWQLDSSGAERLPKTVYVRFLGGVAGNDTYQDDIILDETPPRIRRATLSVGARLKARSSARRYAITVKAVDAVSGPAQVQVAANRAKPGAKRRYASRFTTTARLAPRWIRVVDAAGNHSRWSRLAAR